MSTVTSSPIATTFPLPINLYSKFDILETDLKTYPELRCEILITDQHLVAFNSPSSTKVILFKSNSLNSDELCQLWMALYLKRKIMMPSNFSEDQIEPLLVRAVESVNQIKSNEEKREAANSYYQQLAQKLKEQELEIQSQIFVISNKKKKFELARENNRKIQQLALGLITCKSEEEITFLVTQLFPSYVNPQAQLLIDKSKELLLIQSERRISLELFSKALDSIKSPALIISYDFQVLATNIKLSAQNKKCFQILFNKEQPCSGCQLGESFFTPTKSHLVLSNAIKLQEADPQKKYFFNLYQDQSAVVSYNINFSENQKLKDLSVISASIAHELNNPLAGMLSFTQILLMGIADDDPLKGDLGAIEAGIKRARDIINQLLVFARAQSSFTTSNLDKLVEATIAMVGLSYYESEIPKFKVEISIATDLNPEEISFITYLTKAFATPVLEFFCREESSSPIILFKISATDSEIKFKLGPFHEALALKIIQSSTLEDLLRIFNGIFNISPFDHSLDQYVEVLFRRLDFQPIF